MSDTRERLSDALRFWERGRLVYNLVLIVAVLVALGPEIPNVPPLVWLALVVAAVAANICYSLAYLPDLLVQMSAYAADWRRWGRPLVWLAGMTGSLALALLIIAPESWYAAN